MLTELCGYIIGLVSNDREARVDRDALADVDAAEQRATRPDPDLPKIPDDDEVPVEDALDQARPVRPSAEVDYPTIPDDVPVADALDQARVVPYDEDDDGYG